MPVNNIQAIANPLQHRPRLYRQLLLSLVLVMAGLVSACGYHLRGAYALPTELKTVYLEGASSRLREQFNEVLKNSSGQLTSNPASAGLIVKIFDEDQNRRVLSLSSRGKSNEYELEHRLQFELSTASNKVLLPKEPLNIRRAYYNDQQDIMAKDREEGVIANEMSQQMVRAIMSRARAALETSPK